MFASSPELDSHGRLVVAQRGLSAFSLYHSLNMLYSNSKYLINTVVTEPCIRIETDRNETLTLNQPSVMTVEVSDFKRCDDDKTT